MASEIQKLVTEPLVWIGAAVLCVPLFASGTLESFRDSMDYDAEPIGVTESLGEMAGKEIRIAEVKGDSMKSDQEMSAIPTLPKLKSSSDEAELLENSFVSLPTVKPNLSPPLDPGSLLPEMDRYSQEDADEDESEPDKTEEPESGKLEAKEPDTEKSETNESETDEPEFDFLFGEDPKPETKKALEPESPKEESDDPPKTPEGTSNWLFPNSDSDGRSNSELPVPPLDDAHPPNSTLPGHASGSSMYPHTDGDELMPLMPGRAVPVDIVGQPHSMPGQSFESDFFVEVESGPDWWTPFCQQPFWGSLPTRQTGLDAVVFAAMQNSPYVKLINTEPQMAQTIVSEADAQFDWSAFVETSWNDIDRPVVSLLDTGTAGGRFVQQQLLFESGVKKNLRAGGHLRVGQAWQRTDNNSTFLSPPDQATAQLLLDYRQPLMRGVGKHINNSQVVLAEIGVEATQNGTQVLLQQFLVDVVAEYWELHYARGVLVQRMRSAERAEQLFQEISNHNDAGKWQRDLIRIQAAATARRTDLIRAQNMVATHQETLMNLTYGTGMPDPSSMEIVPVEAPGTFMIPYDLNFVTEMAVQNRPEIKVALSAIKASAIRQNLALNDLKPRLDATVSTFISGVDQNKDIGGAFGNAKNYNPSYAVGVSFEVPIGRRAASSRLQRQQLDYQRLQHQLEQTLGNVRLDARLAYRNVQSLSSELESHKLASQQATQELDVVTEKTATGLLSSSANTSFLIDDLLQSQARLADAEGRLLRSQTDLSVALVQMKRATGQLLQATSMPQIADHQVQQANFEQPIADQLWSAPGTQMQTEPQPGSGSQNDLWSEER